MDPGRSVLPMAESAAPADPEAAPAAGVAVPEREDPAWPWVRPDGPIGSGCGRGVGAGAGRRRLHARTVLSP